MQPAAVVVGARPPMIGYETKELLLSPQATAPIGSRRVAGVAAKSRDYRDSRSNGGRTARPGAPRRGALGALRLAPPCDTEPKGSDGGARTSESKDIHTMPVLLNDYLPLVIFIALAAVISGALLVAPFLLAFKAPDPEKLSAYECGFNAFDDARMKFDVRFYLVSLLFIIFDLEVAFLFPWAVAFRKIGAFGFWSMMVFLAVLTVGFVYEWKKGALEWD